MNLYDQADKIDANNTGAQTDPPLPEGDYPELAVLKIEESRPSKEPHKLYWKCRHVVVSGPHKGKIATIMEQLEGNMYPEHGPQALARVKRLIGQLFGLSDVAQINAQVTGQVIRGCFAQDGKIMAGKIFGATVTHKETKAKKKLISKYDTRVSAGAKEVDVSAAQAEADKRDAALAQGGVDPYVWAAAAPAPAAFAPPPAPAPAPAAFAPPPAPAPAFPPAGWLPHQGQFYKPGMATCITEAELRALAATGRA